MQYCFLSVTIYEVRALWERELGIPHVVVSNPLGNGTGDVHRKVSAEQIAPSTKKADS